MANKMYDLDELRAISAEWTIIPNEMIPNEKQELFIKRKTAIDMYIKGFKMSEIESKTTINHSNIIRLLKRCLALDFNNNYIGYMGLIPSKRINKKTYGEELTHDSFAQLLNTCPEIVDFLKGNYFGLAPYTLERVMNIKTLHDKFLRKCRELNILDDEYPFNTDNCGYHALYRYIQKMSKENIELAINREGKDAKQKLLSTGIGQKYSVNPVAPFSGVQVDGHIIDIIYTTEVYMDDGTIVPMPAHRCWLFAVIDIATRCILGYSMSQEMNYNQFDVLRALKNSILPHEKMNFKIQGYDYPENGGFPSLALPEIQYALFDLIMLDNAKAHLSKKVRDKSLNTIKCALNYGSVATPETRGIVERFFGTLESKGFHRLPMTTDSSIRGVKRRNPEYKAAKYNVTYNDVQEVMEQLIMEYNNSSHSALCNFTPLQEMERKIRQNGMMPAIASAKQIYEIKKLMYYKETRKVSGDIRNGKRPYITYLNAKYRNDLLASSNTFIGQTISLLINPDDVSSVEAFLEDGTPLGELKAVGEKGLITHSEKSRRSINQFSKEKGIENRQFSTPITAFEHELERRSRYSKRDRTKADILRREQGKDTYSEQIKKKEEKPTPIISKEKYTSKTYKMPSADEVKNMTAEDYYKLIQETQRK